MKVVIPTGKKWIIDRQKYLDSHLYHNWKEGDRYSKKHREALEQWFLEGDLTALLKGKGKNFEYSFNLSEIMGLCPAVNADEFFRIMVEVSHWLSRKKFCFWSENRKPTRDEKFESSILETLILGCIYPSAPEVATDIVKKVFKVPATEHIVFPYALGEDNWQPEGNIDLVAFVNRRIFTFSSYLFGDKEDFIRGQKVCSLVDYVLPYVDKINIEYMSLTLSEDNNSIRGGQILLREFLANLCGYNTDFQNIKTLPHNDPILEKRVKEAFENTNMPTPYYELIEFIHLHKEKCVDPFSTDEEEVFY